MDEHRDHVLTESEATDVITEEDFDVRQFLGAMTRKTKRPLTRRRIEELVEERGLRAEIGDSWEE
jgi:hypothetical protein